MKILDPDFQEAIAQPTATITSCWLIERIDGVKLGFTSFDLSFVIDGVTYEPATGFASSADSSESGFKQNDSQSLTVFSAVTRYQMKIYWVGCINMRR